MKYINLKVKELVGDGCFIRNDFETFKLLYNFFLHRPPFQLKILVYFFDFFIYFIAIIFFKTKINLLFSKNLTEDFLIRRAGSGNCPNVIILKRNKYSKPTIRKEFSNKDFLKMEQEYFLKYYKNDAGINLPFLTFNSNYLEYPFINYPSLKMEINRGRYSKSQILVIFKKISSSLDILYKKEKCLIHGDLTPDNIYLLDDKIYFIDYSDSEVYFRDYDKFTLLKKMLKSYLKNEKEISNYLDAYNLNKNSFWRHLKHKQIAKHNYYNKKLA